MTPSQFQAPCFPVFTLTETELQCPLLMREEEPIDFSHAEFFFNLKALEQVRHWLL